MKKLLCLSVLLAGSASATFTAAENLKGVTLCFAPAQVVVNANTDKISVDIKSALHSMVLTKLQAYRVKHTTECSASRHDLYVQLDTVTAPNGLHVYSLSLDVYDWQASTKGAVIYNMGHFGTSAVTGTEFTARITAALTPFVDKLAADYARANP